MTGPWIVELAPVLVLLLVLASDAWVYADATAWADSGAPVTFSTRSFEVATPAAWLTWCLLLWVVFFPLYLRCRDQDRGAGTRYV